jgi:hypothetical protein
LGACVTKTADRGAVAGTGGGGSPSSAGPEEAGRYYERAGGFTIRPPESWEAVEFPGLQYKVILGPGENGQRPNITFLTETDPHSISEYGDLVLQAVQDQLGAYTLIKREDFVTAGNINGERVIIHLVQDGYTFRRTLYLLPGKADTKLAAACTALADGGAAYDSPFEQAMKTFAWIE